MKFNRVFLIVLDSLGVGEASDALKYDDVGSNTLGHINEARNLFVPNLEKLGFLDTLKLSNKKDVDAYYKIASTNNHGKDTLNGHYEMMGIKITEPFKYFYKEGFPKELINEIERQTKRKVIGNVAASGTEIIQELGEQSIMEGSLIVYTSHDSVLQVAAHEKVIPVDMLYKYCEIIRRITTDNKWKVGRVIARPFVGRKKGEFKRTTGRRDFSLNPPYKSVLNYLQDHDLSVISIGKIYDIFNGQGITKKISSGTNKEGIDKILDIMDKKFTGLCFANLNDFDCLYGHRRDVNGYADAIEALDVEIPLMLNKLNPDDLLIITADHGNDPTFKGTDHTREYVPVIVYSSVFKEPKQLDKLPSLADVGATIAENFNVEKPAIGNSFLNKLK